MPRASRRARFGSSEAAAAAADASQVPRTSRRARFAVCSTGAALPCSVAGAAPGDGAPRDVARATAASQGIALIASATRPRCSSESAFASSLASPSFIHVAGPFSNNCLSGRLNRRSWSTCRTRLSNTYTLSQWSSMCILFPFASIIMAESMLRPCAELTVRSSAGANGSW